MGGTLTLILYIVYPIWKHPFPHKVKKDKFLHCDLMMKNCIISRVDPPLKKNFFFFLPLLFLLFLKYKFIYFSWRIKNKERFKKSAFILKVVKFLYTLITCQYCRQLMGNNFAKRNGRRTFYFHLVRKKLFIRFLHLNKENVRNYPG